MVWRGIPQLEFSQFSCCSVKQRVFLAEGKIDLLNYQNKNMPEGIDPN
jgi:hypothetical protein